MKFEDPYETEVTEFEFNSFHIMPSKNHSFLQTRIAGLLDFKYRKDYSILTAVDLDLSSGKAIPDIAVFHKLSFDWGSDEVKMTQAPLVAIEIISPRQAVTDISDKIYKIYFPAGVKSAWIVFPSLETIQIVLPNGQKTSFATGIIKDTVAGIELDFADIFE